MTTLDFQQHRDEFSRIARRKQEVELTQERDRTRRKEDSAKHGDDLLEDIVALASVPASETEIEAFTTKLDRYDEAIVHALMANEKRLTEVDARIKDALSRAYVLEDGRRVFKSEDGVHVYDEFGGVVGPDELDPDLIPDYLPRSETFLADRQEELAAMAEQAEIFAFRDELDAGREYATGGEATKVGLEDLEGQLQQSVPASVQAEMGEPAAPATQTDLADAQPQYRGATLGMPTL